MPLSTLNLPRPLLYPCTLLQPPLSLSLLAQILGFVDDYVFYADIDIMFVQDISLATFAPLPAFFAVAVETEKLVASRKPKLDPRYISRCGHSTKFRAMVPCKPEPNYCNVPCMRAANYSRWVKRRLLLGRLSSCDIDPKSIKRPTPSKHSTNGSRAGIPTSRPMVPCMGEVDYGNAGVMLLHVERMRRTHAGFVRFIFSEQVVAAGMDHGIYGPADQGAYNKFFAGRFDIHLEASWNWKPYWGHAANVSLVHFHGPKPHEYFAHKANNTGSSDGFRGLFDRCDTIDRENATLRLGQPGCMAYSHRYAKELTKVLQVQPAWLRSAVVMEHAPPHA